MTSIECDREGLTSEIAARAPSHGTAFRALHLRWVGDAAETADWTVRESAIDKRPRGSLGAAAAIRPPSLTAAADAIVLEIPASSFQPILFPHRNPLKSLFCLPLLIPFLWNYLILLSFLARAGKPLVIFDLQDSAGIAARFLPFLKIAACYHKRELPRCVANAFQHSEIFAIEPWRNRLRYAGEIAKLRPLSIGAAFAPIPFRLRTRDIDIFWAGTLDNSPARDRGVRLLRELEQEGYRVVILEERLDREAFLEHLARASLTFCPDGNGWQCWRMLEAGCLGSVPLLSYPTIWQDQPFRHGERCFYFNPDGDDIKKIARAALADREHLRQMSAAVREFVTSSHVEAAVYYRHLGGLHDQCPHRH